MKANCPSCKGTVSRFIVPDPSSPGTPAAGGKPAIPAGYREATTPELILWQQRGTEMLRACRQGEGDLKAA